MTRSRGLALLAAAVAVGLAAAGCSGDGGPTGEGGDGTATTSSAVEDFVPFGASAIRSARVEAGGRSEPVPEEVVAGAFPMLTARRFEAVEPLASYGLEDPVARVTVVSRSGEEIVLDLGGPNFDSLGRYARRSGDPHVYLVLAEQIDPLLALVGIEPIRPSEPRPESTTSIPRGTSR